MVVLYGSIEITKSRASVALATHGSYSSFNLQQLQPKSFSRLILQESVLFCFVETQTSVVKPSSFDKRMPRLRPHPLWQHLLSPKYLSTAVHLLHDLREQSRRYETTPTCCTSLTDTSGILVVLMTNPKDLQACKQYRTWSQALNSHEVDGTWTDKLSKEPFLADVDGLQEYTFTAGSAQTAVVW